jgi:hypothetical protein
MGVFLLLLASTYYPAPSTTLPKHDIESLPVFTAQSNKQRQREADLDRILTSTLQPEHTYLASHDVSAILVHHRRPKALALQLRALSRLAFIREVIVFNVNDHVDLSKAVSRLGQTSHKPNIVAGSAQAFAAGEPASPQSPQPALFHRRPSDMDGLLPRQPLHLLL